jgi:hypothetical protein
MVKNPLKAIHVLEGLQQVEHPKMLERVLAAIKKNR